MQRLSALLLLILITFPLIGQVVFAGSEPQIPACCRRDGRHHCAMEKATQPLTSAAGVRAMGEKCPYYPSSPALQAHGNSPFERASQSVIVSLADYSAIQAQSEALYRISYNRSRQKRGPPFLHS